MSFEWYVDFYASGWSGYYAKQSEYGSESEENVVSEHEMKGSELAALFCGV